MSETRGSLKTEIVLPVTAGGKVALLSKRFLAFVREDMLQLSEMLDNPGEAKEIIIQAIEDTLVSNCQLPCRWIDKQQRGPGIREG